MYLNGGWRDVCFKCWLHASCDLHTTFLEYADQKHPAHATHLSASVQPAAAGFATVAVSVVQQLPPAPQPLLICCASKRLCTLDVPAARISDALLHALCPVACDAGYALRLERLVLANIALPDPVAEAGVPRLWPLGLFAEPGSELYMADVRLVVRDVTDLKRYVQFFQGLPSSKVQYYTVSCCTECSSQGKRDSKRRRHVLYCLSVCWQQRAAFPSHAVLASISLRA